MGEPARKRARAALTPLVPEKADDGGLGGLYDFLPPPDPVKDALALETASSNPFARQKLPPAERSRVVFLDIDGVLLPVGSLETILVDGVPVPSKTFIPVGDFAVAAVANVRSIVQQTGATIVLSSEWRRTEKLRDSVNAVLRSQDMDPLRGSTEIHPTKLELAKQHGPKLAWCERRAREITKWLRDHPEVTSWVALDDLDFAWADAVRVAGTSFIKHRSVLTDDRTCLTEADADAAVQILLNPPPPPAEFRQGLGPRRMSRDQEAPEGAGQMFVSTEDSMPDRIRLG